MFEKLREERRKGRYRKQSFDDAFQEASGEPRRKQIQDWSNDELHKHLAGGLSTAARSMAERELRRREAWESPGGRAFYISIFALIVAVVSLLLSIFKPS